MANIPISQIPNAPQAGAPVLAPTLPGVQPLQPINLGPGLDGSGIAKTRGILAGASDSISQSNDSVARATAGTKRNLIDPGPFVAEAGAGQFVGEALQHAGNVAENFAAQMMQAKDAMDMSRVDSILRNARDQHQIDITQNGISPDQWVPSWNEKQGEVQEQIKALNISPRIKGQVDADSASFWGQQTNRFALAATTQSISDAKNEATVNINKAFDDGDWDVAATSIKKMQDAKIFSKAEAQQQWNNLESKHRDTLVNSAITADPKSVLDATTEALKTKSTVKGLDWLDASKDPAQVAKVQSISRSQFHQYQEDASHSLDNDILTGKVTTPEQVRTIGADAKFDERDIQSFEKSLAVTVANTPAGQAKYQSTLDSLHTEVAAYDPAKDADGAIRRRLRAHIRETAVEGDREDFMDQIDAAVKNGMTPNAQLKSAFFTQIDDLGKQGLLGATGTDEKGKIIDPKASLDLSIKSQQYKAQVTEFLAKNPSISANDAKDRFQQIFKDSDPAGEVAKSYGSKSSAVPGFAWPNGGWFQWKNNSNPPPNINQQIDTKLGGKPMSGLFNGSGKTMATNTPTQSTTVPKTPIVVKEVTSYWPGSKSQASDHGLSGAVEGGEKDAHGNVIYGNTTFEDYQSGRGDYVTVAMDKDNPLAKGKSYLTSPQFPGVVFRVMDNGGYGNGKTGTNWIDIAYKDPEKAKSQKLRNVQFQVVTASEAEKISADRNA